MKPAKRIKVGTTVSFGDGLLTATVTEELEHGGRMIEFHYDGIFMEILEKLGETPLPPYIKEKLDDPERYQTVYAKENGSALRQLLVYTGPKNYSNRFKIRVLS